MSAPSSASTMKWLAVATITNAIRNGYSSHSTRTTRVARQARERPADHQRERDVHRGHRRVRVEQRGHRRARVRDVHAGEVRDGVDEAPLGHEPRRRRREHDVADERDRHRDHEHVAHEVEGAVVAQVQVEQRGDRDRSSARSRTASWRAPSHVAARRPRLHARLDEQVQRRARSRSGRARARRRRWRRPRRDRARGGRRSRRREQRDLAQHVQPSVRQDARLQETSAGDHRAKPRRCSAAAGAVVEDAREREVDHDVQAARARPAPRPAARRARTHPCRSRAPSRG